MLIKSPLDSCAGWLGMIAFFTLAGTGFVRAQAERPLDFDELFPNRGSTAPMFTRPDVISRSPKLDDTGQATAASASPLQKPELPGVSEKSAQQDASDTSPRIDGALSYPSAEVVEIRIHGSIDGSQVWFDPVGVLVQPGQAVRFVNRDPVYSHTVTAYHPKFGHPHRIPERAEPWNSGYLLPNQTYSIRLTEEGVYDFYCVPHERAGMVGRIVVKRAAAAGGQQSIEVAGVDAGAEAVPEAARRAFPSVEEIIRLGVVHPRNVGQSEARVTATPGGPRPGVERRPALLPGTRVSEPSQSPAAEPHSGAAAGTPAASRNAPQDAQTSPSPSARLTTSLHPGRTSPPRDPGRPRHVGTKNASSADARSDDPSNRPIIKRLEPRGQLGGRLPRRPNSTLPTSRREQQLRPALRLPRVLRL